MGLFFDNLFDLFGMGSPLPPDGATRKETLQREIAELRAKVDGQPHPVHYSRLADIYRDIGDYEKALELCKKTIEAFPDYEGAWIVLGKMSLQRFKEEWIAHDAMVTIQHYEKACELNNTSYTALFELADLYTEIGAKLRATRTCDSILRFAPEDGAALRLLQECLKIPYQQREDVEELVKIYAEKRKGEQRPERRRDSDSGR